MKFIIERVGDNIVRVQDFHNPKDKGEIAHFLAEIETARQELVDLWNIFDDLNREEPEDVFKDD